MWLDLKGKRRKLRLPGTGDQPAWLAAAATCALGGWLALSAFRTPVTLTEQVTDQQIELKTVFTQHVTPIESALYPEPEPLTNEASFYMRLLDELTLDINAVLTAAPAAEIEGTASLVVHVVAPERWSKTFVVIEEHAIGVPRGTDRVVVFDDSIVLPLEEYKEFIAIVEDETRVAPRDDYQIVVAPVIDVRAAGPDAAVSKRFEVPFTFRLAGNTLHADGPYERRLSAAVTHDVTHPGTVRLLGRDWPVVPVRAAGLLLMAPALGMLAVFGWRKRQEAAAVPEAERLLRRYRGRTIEVTAEPQAIPRSTVSLRSFPDLLRLADHLDQTIFVLRMPDETRFMIIDGETVYSFRPMATDRTFPSKRAAGSMRAEHPSL